jgi:hypothetical protein
MLAITFAILTGETGLSPLSRTIARANTAMNKPKLLAAALAFGVLAMPVVAAAQTDGLTTAFFEKNNVAPRNAAKLRTTIADKTISIKTLKSGAVELVYYGAQRIDATGERTKYKIGKGGIEEEHDGAPRMLLIYDWQGHAYVCLENVGELDVLDDAAGTCPYEIIAALQGNHIRGR